MNADTSREMVIFTEVLEIPPDQRGSHLDRACAGDDKLRSKVLSLLLVHERVGKFLEEPPTGLPFESPHGPTSIEKAGDRIGRYKLLEQIGEGGCGVVFLAEQEQPVHRRVALKVIKPGMDTRSVIARFEAERQALALMDHPNIAKLFDAGATEAGRPYFVMELVSGKKITDYCDQQELSIDQRLRLFVQICQGVQHAHQKGVIHRDIKPSNILVETSSEGAALPVVIDFGIAKATTQGRLTDKTIYTVFDFLIGTPAYMSPEQAALSGVDVDSRTDVYSLGVLLYELVTGTTPFNTRQMQTAGLEEILRSIREEEPARPSTKLRRMLKPDLKARARCRHSEPFKLIRSVRGDLEWITMKALEKDRARRYATANGISEDIKRYMAGETISARQPSAAYKLQKTIARNKPLFAGISVVILLLAFLLIRESQAHRRSATEAAKSRQVTRFLEQMLQGVGPSVARGRNTDMLVEILDRTTRELGNGTVNQPEVEAEGRFLLGKLYHELRKLEDAEKMDRRALELYRKYWGPNSRETAAALNELSVALCSEGKLTEAEVVAQESLNIRRALFGNENAEVATSLNNLAHVYLDSGKWSEAEVLTREALAIRRRLFPGKSLEVADSLRNLGIALGDQGHWQEAVEAEQEVLAIRRTHYGDEHPWVAAAMVDLAWALGGTGALDDAAGLEHQALAMRERMLPKEHPDIAVSLALVGDRERQRGNLDMAQTLLNSARVMESKLLGRENPAFLDTMRSLALTLDGQGKPTEAEEVQREALALWQKMGLSGSPRGATQLGDLAQNLMGQNRWREARQVLDEGLDPTSAKSPPVARLLVLRASLRGRAGLWKDAAADSLSAFEIDSDHFDMPSLAALLLKSGDIAGYENYCNRLLAASAGTTDPYAADAVAKSCSFSPVPHLDRARIGRLADVSIARGVSDGGAWPYFMDCKALTEYRLGHFAEAADWSGKALSTTGTFVHQHAYAILAMADWQLGKKDEARAMLAKGNELTPGALPTEIAEKLGNEWLGWLYARIQLDEASALIKPNSTNDANSAKL